VCEHNNDRYSQINNGRQRNYVRQPLCYNEPVDDIKAYCDRWQAVADFEQQELQAASLELRWQQFNALIGLAVDLGILKSDDSEGEIYQRWANLKEKAASLHL
jgi:hypothetical protein